MTNHKTHMLVKAQKSRENLCIGSGNDVNISENLLDVAGHSNTFRSPDRDGEWPKLFVFARHGSSHTKPRNEGPCPNLLELPGRGVACTSKNRLDAKAHPGSAATGTKGPAQPTQSLAHCFATAGTLLSSVRRSSNLSDQSCITSSSASCSHLFPSILSSLNYF